MSFVRIDNNTNRLYPGVFKICAKRFWLSVSALFNNIYIKTIIYIITINNYSYYLYNNHKNLFLTVLRISELRIFWSSLFHSITAEGKKEF